jgi:gliding motility-associated transport system permease protein
MRNAWAVCKREFESLFSTPVGYVVLGTFALISGLSFTASFLFYGVMSESPSTYDFPAVPNFEETFLSPYLVYAGMIMLFIAPLITMRLLAEEKNQGTIEMLLTHPLRDREIIAGKYGAALLMLLLMMSTVMLNLAIIYYFVDVEPAVLVFGLFTFFLMGAAFLSLGLFVSSVCSNQITAATATFGLFFLSFIMSYYADEMPETVPAPAGWPESAQTFIARIYDLARSIVAEVPVDAHAKDMAQGILQPYDIAYYVLFSAFFLFLTFRVLESRKWRG